MSSSPDKQKLPSLGVLCASAVNKLGNNRRDAEFAENICFAQSGDGDWAKTTAQSAPEIHSDRASSGVSRERKITTKSTKDTKGKEVVKFFVIFVYFVVNKHYPKIEEKIG